MKLFGVLISYIDWRQLYTAKAERCRKLQLELREVKKTAGNLATELYKAREEVDDLYKSNVDVCHQNDTLRALLDEANKENARLKAVVESMSEDELAIRCQSLTDENKALTAQVQKYKAKKAASARRYRENKKRTNELSALDMDVLIKQARDAGYDICYSVEEKYPWYLVSRADNSKITFPDVQQVLDFINPDDNGTN